MGFAIRPDAASFTHRGCLPSGAHFVILHSKPKFNLVHFSGITIGHVVPETGLFDF